MHVRFSGCVGNLVLPYYSIDYLYSILNLPCIMIDYNKSTVVFISQLKGAVHPLVLTNQGIRIIQDKGSSTPSLSLFVFHNLNNVSAFYYPCFVLPRLALALAYLSLHLTLPLVC